MRTSRKVVVGALACSVGAALLLGVVVFVLEALTFVSGGPFSTWSGTTLIAFGNIHFFERDGFTVTMVTGELQTGEPLAPLYVRFPNCPGETYLLPELTGDDIQRLALSQKALVIDGVPWTEYVVAETDIHGSTAVYESTVSVSKGRVVGLTIVERSGVSFSKSKDGEFLELPVKRSEVIKLFGKPLKVQRQMNAHT